jgi:ABC-type multidrug transport system fused ATPase/permease subunit
VFNHSILCNKKKICIALTMEIHCKQSCIHDWIHALEQKEIVAHGYLSSSEKELAALARVVGV